MSVTLSFSYLFVFLVIISSKTFITPSSSATNSFVFGGCSQLKYTPGSPYENNVNSLLTSLVNSAMSTSYNNFTVPGIESPQDTLYGLFQCRGDLMGNDCSRCVAFAVSQLGTLCVDSFGGVLQLEGCFVKYDNTSFLGVEDKTEVVKKCGPSTGYDSDALTRRDAVLASCGTGDGGAYKTYRTSNSGDVQGVAQCVGDLSPSECQDCLTEAIGRLRTECGTSVWADMYLAKCYVRYVTGGVRSHGTGNEDDSNDNENDNEVEKTLAIIIGIIAAVALIIVFVSFLNKLCDTGKECK